MKPQENKSARMPQNELIDRLFVCFKRYKFWSMKALKQELHQPEAFLKETLDLVAVLARSGVHAMTYRLKPEYEKNVDLDVKDEGAPEDESSMGDEDDEDDDLQMEDVL